MRGKRIQSIVTAGRWTLPAVIIICIICWIGAGLLLDVNYDISTSYTPLGALSTVLNDLPTIVNKLGSFALYAIIGYILIEINNVFGIIRTRASAQTVFYFLLISACPSMHLLYPGDIASVSYLLALFFLFRSYHRHQSSFDLFYSFAFIGFGTMFFPQLVYFIPLWLFGIIKFQSINIKSICAAIIGLSFPYWFLFSHAYFYQDMTLFYQPFIEMVSFEAIEYRTQMPIWELATLVYLFILYIGSAVHYFRKGYQDKIQTRSYLDYLLVVGFFTFVFILLQPSQGINLFPILLINSSILTAHLFVLTHSKASNLFFIFTLVSLVILFFFNLWTLL